MRIKLNLVAAGVAMVVANSGVNATALNAANEIFIGGATAPQNFAREDILQRICGSNIQVFVDKVKNKPGGIADVIAGNLLQQGDHFVIRCTTKGDGTLPPDLDNAGAGVDLALYKFNGGSATGVAPVADPAAAAAGDKSYLDASVANCGGTPAASGLDVLGDPDPTKTYDLYVCPGAPVSVQNPDAGISDVEPTIFTGSLALDFGTEPRGVTQRPDFPYDPQFNSILQIKPGAGLVFGVAVTLAMYDELTDDQNNPANPAGDMLPDCPANPTRAQRDAIACMPSLPKPMIRSVFAGQVASWASVAPYGNALNPVVPEGNNVHICKRTNGSGTHAQVSVEYLGTNCRATSNIGMSEQNDGLSSASFGLIGVYANSGSSDMDDCMDALGDGLGFNGDFAGLPPENFPDTGDSTVVPGTGLAATLIPGDPRSYSYNTEVRAYAIGYNSLEKNTSLGRQYRFVKVDGVEPTLEKAVAGEYSDVYYLSYQNRVVSGTLGGLNTPDLQGGVGQLRTAAEAADAGRISVAKAFFNIWDATDAAAIDLINKTLVVDPDGTPGNADDWQGGFVVPVKGASFNLVSGTPETPWARQSGAGTPDSCQDLGLVR